MKPDFPYRWTVLGVDTDGVISTIVNNETREKVLAAASDFVKFYNSRGYETFYLIDRNSAEMFVDKGTLTRKIPPPPPPAPITWFKGGNYNG